MFQERGQIPFILSIFAGIVLSQYIFVYANVGTGIILSLVMVILIYTIISIKKMSYELIRTAESLALIPLYVLFTSSLPWFFIEQEFILPMVYSLILGLCFLHMYQYNINWKDVGIVKGRMKIYVIGGCLAAIPTGITEYLILLPPVAYPSLELQYLIRDILYMTFFVALGEELLFRGLIMNDLTKIIGLRNSIWAQGFLFGVMHMTWRSVPELGFTFLAGVLLGYIYHRTGSLIGPIALHAMNNVLLVGVLPYIW